MTADPMLRASDRDRERVIGLLGDHLTAGRLDLQEFDERVAAAYAARSLGDLAALLGDLPDVAPAASDDATEPSARPESRHWVNWLIVGLICILIWAATSIASGRPMSFWPIWVIGPWGAILLARTLTGQTGGCGTTRRWSSTRSPTGGRRDR